MFMKKVYSISWLTSLFCLFWGFAHGGNPACNVGQGSNRCARAPCPTYVNGKPVSMPTTSAARRAAAADLAYANVNVAAKARLKKEAGILLESEPIVIDRADYVRLAQPGNQFTLLLSEENSQLMVNIGRADDQQAQRWVLPGNLSDRLPLGLGGDFIRPDDVPMDLRFEGTTHVLRLSDGQTTRYQSFQVKADEVELLGYSMDLYDTGNDYKISDNFLNTSKYSDLPLNLGDEFKFVNEIVSTDRSERIETRTHLDWDAYGVLETPNGTFNALRFTSKDTTFSYQGSSTTPYSQSVSQRVGWVTKEGVLFDGQIQSYDPTTGQATLIQTNYQTITQPTAPVSPPFSITGVTMVSCQAVSAGLRTLTFDPQYVGTNGQPISFSVVNEMLPTTNPGPYSLRLYTDNPVITLKAMQSGTAGEASFTYNWLAVCNGGTTPPANQAPTTSGIANQTAAVGQPFSLNIAPSFSDPNGDALTYSASGLPAGLMLAGSSISGTPSMSGVSNVTVTATDPGSLSVSTSFQLTINPAGVVAPPTSPFSITGVTTVSCTTVSAGLRTLTFDPLYVGTNGQPISFSVVNELLPTTQPGPYTINLYIDNPVITLKAIQSGTAGEASFSYNWLAACNTNARIGVSQTAELVLSVQVLGNPARDNQVSLEVRGAGGQPLRLQLTDMQGQVLGTHVIEQAGGVERHRFELVRGSAGLLLLRASTPTQSQTVKVLRAD